MCRDERDTSTFTGGGMPGCSFREVASGSIPLSQTDFSTLMRKSDATAYLSLQHN